MNNRREQIRTLIRIKCGELRDELPQSNEPIDWHSIWNRACYKAAKEHVTGSRYHEFTRECIRK